MSTQPIHGSTPLDHFLGLHVEAEELLAQIRELASHHWDTHPDELTWGDVGDLSRRVQALRFALNLTDDED